MQQIFLILDVVFAVALIALVLIQQGKGATMGAAFGAGASQTVFGSQGAGSFMLKLTSFVALMFFAISLWLGHMAAVPVVAKKTTVLEQVSQISKMENKQQTNSAAAAVSKLSTAGKKPVKKK